MSMFVTQCGRLLRVKSGLYPGMPYGGGFYVSTFLDKDGAEYHLIVSGADGDSVLREASSTGVPDSGGNGQMNWRSDNNDLVVPDSHSTDGKYNTDTAMDWIQEQVDAEAKVWTEFPIFNFIRYLNDENMGGYDDWYIPAQASTTNFPIYDDCVDGWGGVGENESEIAALFGYLLGGQDTNRNWQDAECYDNTLDEPPEHLQKFFNDFAGEQQFDPGRYWSSTESGALARRLAFFDGAQLANAKSTSTGRVRAVRRVYT